VCVTEEFKKILAKDYGVSTQKMIVVPNGVNTDFMAPYLHQVNRLHKEFTVGFVGAFYPWAGLNLIIDAFNLIKEMKIRLTIVGDGLIKTEILKNVHTYGLEPHVSFVGQVSHDKIPSYILGFDVCYSGQTPHGYGVMYGSPIKMYEYMAMGKPVIASAYEDAKSLINDRKDGYLFDPCSVESLVLAIRDAKESAHSMNSGEIREKIVKYHSWENRASKIIVAL
jgi:glycosyltransferase involved in cell wall biosynthesis